MNWTAPAVQRARELWAAGWSAGAIARELGCSKNSVVGMKHRRPGFAPRPSPIVREGETHWTEAPPTVRVTPVVLVLPPPPRPDEHAPNRGSEPSGGVPPPPVVLVPARIAACRWPLWTDATPRVLRAFCGDPCEGEGGPYCREHHALAHMPTPRGRRVAA